MNEGGFAYPFASRMSTSTSVPKSTPTWKSNGEVNLSRIRELMEGRPRHHRHQEPAGAKHSLGVGILNRLNLIIEGSLGYFGCRPDRWPQRAHQRPRRLVLRENMMAGTVVIEKNAGSTFGAAIRGGDLVCKGSVGSRTGIDQKGGTIIVGGDTGAFSGFMMQRGRMVVLRQRRQEPGRFHV